MSQGATGGFTLIELMIVVAVVAILAAIALPSYNDAVRKSRRGQAKADITEYAQLAERFRSINNTYVGFLLPTTVSPREAGATVRYNLALAPASSQAAFRITATAVGDQVNDTCGNLSIAHTGAKTNSRGALSQCW